MTKSLNWRAVMEHAYDLSGSLEGWLQGLVDLTACELDAGLGTVAYSFDMTAEGDVAVDDFVVHGGPPGALEMAREVNMNGPQEFLARMVYAATSVPNLRNAFPDEIEYIEGYLEKAGVKDAFGLACLSRSHCGVMLTAPHPEPMQPTKRQIKVRERLATHIGAGFRLRSMCAPGDLDDPSVEAIFDGDKVAHAEGPARDALETLRDAVRRVDRVRAGKDDPDTGLDAWQGLVDGRWSLVDHFDSDQKRFVVAHRNDPGCEDPRGLSHRERQVAEYFGLGRAAKEIAYTLGVTPTYVDNVLARVMEKLGLNGRAEMALFFSPLGTRRTIKLFQAGGEDLAMGELAASQESLSSLNAAERNVVELALRGATAEAIARERGVSVPTIATQLQQVYRRFGVGSRAELALALLGPSPLRDGSYEN